MSWPMVKRYAPERHELPPEQRRLSEAERAQIEAALQAGRVTRCEPADGTVLTAEQLRRLKIGRGV